MEKQVKLKKHLGLLDVFSIAAGAMISSGLFVLPAIVYRQGGPAIIASYMLASLLMLPSVFAKAELATAMPRSGGTYFYVKRSFGALWGLFCGISDWFSLALKSAFAIMGIALFCRMFCLYAFDYHLADWQLKAIAVGCCVFFGAINCVSVEHTTKFQNILVAAMIAILGFFIISGISHVQATRFEPFAPYGKFQILVITGAVFISFGGLTHVATIAEEVRHPGRLLPMGMILAWLVVSLFYIATVFVTIGVLDSDKLAASDAPISTAASAVSGPIGGILLTLAALAAFITTANGGILAASRSPMAVSRDHLLPAQLARVSKRFGTPVLSIVLTSAFMVIAIVFLELEQLVKVASALLLLMFTMDNACVIMMRQSKILTYRPKFKMPLYPYLPAVTIVIYLILLVDMGKLPFTAALIFLAFSTAWYYLFAARRVRRDSAVMHVVQRVTDREIISPTLENELRDILFERDNIIADRFDHLLSDCTIFDLKGKKTAQEVFEQAAAIFSEKVGIDKQVLVNKLLAREAEGSTVLEPGLAIPHVVIEGQNKFAILPVRAADGIDFPHAKDPVKTVFFLAGTKDERNYHLRALMAIAQIVQEKDFYTRWFAARDTDALRNLLLLSKRKRDTAQ
jgi:amino acid transporter/mannitol/fructose-specific phosphotransferase system IIA component (Ntr-type)